MDEVDWFNSIRAAKDEFYYFLGELRPWVKGKMTYVSNVTLTCIQLSSGCWGGNLLCLQPSKSVNEGVDA
jgi:hypothetical protein